MYAHSHQVVNNEMLTPVQMRMARAALNWTVRELAQRAGVDKNTISRYEAGREILTGTIQKIEDIFIEQGVVLLSKDGQFGPGVRLSSEFVSRPPVEKRKTKKRSQKR